MPCKPTDADFRAVERTYGCLSLYASREEHAERYRLAQAYAFIRDLDLSGIEVVGPPPVANPSRLRRRLP